MNALPEYNALTLIASDSEDLAVVAGLIQDSLFPILDSQFDVRKKTFVVVLNRFCWEMESKKPPYIRTHSILHFNNVISVSSQDVDKSKDRIYNLLSIIPVRNGDDQFVYLTLAGGGVIRLCVEDIKATLKDVGDAWHTASRPVHENSDLSDDR